MFHRVLVNTIIYNDIWLHGAELNLNGEFKKKGFIIHIEIAEIFLPALLLWGDVKISWQRLQPLANGC